MLETLLTLALQAAIVVLVAYALILVLDAVGVPIPANVIKIIWAIVALILLLYVVRVLLGWPGPVVLPG